MPLSLPLRSDFDAAALHRLARSSSDANQTRRLLALASLYDGSPRHVAARQACVTPQIVRDWVVRFNAEGPDGLIDRKAPGKMAILTPQQRAALAGAVEAGPEPWRDGVVRWRLIDLAQWLHDEFAGSLDETTISRELKKLGYVKLTARPRHHAQNEHAMEAFKRGASLPSWQKSEQRSRRARP